MEVSWLFKIASEFSKHKGTIAGITDGGVTTVPNNASEEFSFVVMV